MEINEAIITYFGQKAKVKCDRNCNKAWGYASRPFEQLSDNNDDIMWYGDDELDDAPIDPQTYEGGFGKPLSPDEFPQKWCVRQCERCVMSSPNKVDDNLELIDWQKRRFNIKRERKI